MVLLARRTGVLAFFLGLVNLPLVPRGVDGPRLPDPRTEEVLGVFFLDFLLGYSSSQSLSFLSGLKFLSLRVAELRFEGRTDRRFWIRERVFGVRGGVRGASFEGSAAAGLVGDARIRSGLLDWKGRGPTAS